MFLGAKKEIELSNTQIAVIEKAIEFQPTYIYGTVMQLLRK
jgi:hypothetical protein